MKKFKKVYVEITNICNLSCAFCHKTKRQHCFMSVELFEHIINEIKPYTDFIYMHVMGEPLMHKDIGKFLDICEVNGIKANITTNGTLIKEKGKSIENKKALRQVNFSLHSLDANVTKLSNEKYMDNILEFVRKTSPNGLINCLRLWNLKKGEKISNNDYILEKLRNEFNLKEDIVEKVTDRNGVKLDKNVYLQQTYEFKWPDINEDEIFMEGYCFGLKTHLGILVDGTVVPCCLDCEGDIILGNIKENSFSEIINSKRTNTIIEGFRCKRPVEKLCRTCGWNVMI